MKKYRPTLQYLLIDITQEKWSVHQLSQEVHTRYLGGNSLALYLFDLYREEFGQSYEVEPLVFTPGLFSQMNLFEGSSLSIAGRSPYMDEVRVTQGNAPFSSCIGSCGFCAVVLVGSGRRTISIEISDTSVTFTPQERLYGKSVSESLAQLDLPKDKTALMIGPSAEQGVLYSAIVANNRSVEREGFGYLLGTKRVKALIIQKGEYLYESMDQDSLLAQYSKIQESIVSSEFSALQKKEFNVSTAHYALKNGYASVAHSTKRTDPRGIHLQGSFHPEYYQSEGYPFWEVGVRDTENNLVPMDSSTLLAFGSNIKNYHPQLAATCTRHCIDMGLDPISTACVISWAMEANQRGLVTDIPVRYNDFSQIQKVITNIVHQTDYGSRLAKGTAFLADYYQNKEFVLSINNKEMLPFDPRGAYGMALVMALGYDYYFPEELMNKGTPSKTFKGKGKAVLQSEILIHLGSLIGIHPIAMGAYMYRNSAVFNRMSKQKLSRSLKPLTTITSQFIQIPFDEQMLLQAAEQAILLEQDINTRGREDHAVLPLQFLLDGKSNFDDDSTVPITKLLQEYILQKQLLGLTL